MLKFKLILNLRFNIINTLTEANPFQLLLIKDIIM